MENWPLASKTKFEEAVWTPLGRTVYATTVAPAMTFPSSPRSVPVTISVPPRRTEGPPIRDKVVLVFEEGTGSSATKLTLASEALYSSLPA